jgi:hypothetical protein
MQDIDSAVTNRSQIERCIDTFVEETRYVPPEAAPVYDVKELTPRLERFSRRLPVVAWRAWSEGIRIWFVLGQFVEGSADRVEFPTVHLVFLDQDATPVASGVWHRVASGHWDLIAPLAPAIYSRGSSLFH